MSKPTVRLFSPADDAHLIPEMAALHAACITRDQFTATFLPPLDHEKMLAWWRELVAEVGTGRRFISILLDEAVPGSGAGLVGVVSLSMPPSETGPFRGGVEKLIVSPDYRRRGAARALMNHLEAEALERGRHLLILDTEAGSPAEEVYRRFKFTEMGRIPSYGICPTGELIGGVFFYKHF